MGNQETVRGIYAAFGSGNIPAILERMSDEVEWEYAYPDRGVAYLKPGRGRPAVAAFFRALADTVDFTKFEIKAIVGDGEVVVALCDVGLTIRSTGKSIGEEDEPHIWHFDAKGRIQRFRHGCDTARHLEANHVGIR